MFYRDLRSNQSLNVRSYCRYLVLQLELHYFKYISLIQRNLLLGNAGGKGNYYLVKIHIYPLATMNKQSDCHGRKSISNACQHHCS